MSSLRFLLDTNICVYIKNRRDMRLVEAFNRYSFGELAVSVITLGELEKGIAGSDQPEASRRALETILRHAPALPIDDVCARHYGEIAKHLQRAGTPIGNNDLWIAAHARALDVTLVSNNIREFQRVPQLKLEQWL